MRALQAKRRVLRLAFFIFLVRMRGLEPPRCHHHRLLRPARLPVPPHPRTDFDFTNASVECQATILSVDDITAIGSTNAPVASLRIISPASPMPPGAVLIVRIRI